MKPLADTGKRLIEFLAIAGPLVCLIHCLAAPILLCVLPLVGNGASCQHCFNDEILVWPILAICAAAILPGYFQHRRFPVLLLMLAGFACVLAGVWSESLVGEPGHVALSITGSICLIAANLKNRTAGAPGCCGGHPAEGTVAVTVNTESV